MSTMVSKNLESKSQMIQYFNDNLFGNCSNNYIYINRDIDELTQCATIGHEFIHYIRNASLKYCTNKEIFKEEFIADMAFNEILSFFNNSNDSFDSTLDKYNYNDIAQHILIEYKLKQGSSLENISKYVDEYIETMQYIESKIIL